MLSGFGWKNALLSIGRGRSIFLHTVSGRPARFQTLAQAACRSVAAAPLVIRRLLVLAASSPPFRLRLHVLLLDASSSSPAPPPPSPPTRVAVLRSRSSGCSGQLAVVSSQWSAQMLSLQSSAHSAQYGQLAFIGSTSWARSGWLAVIGLHRLPHSARLTVVGSGCRLVSERLCSCVACSPVSYARISIGICACRMAVGSRLVRNVVAVGSRLVRNVVCVSPVQFCTEICAHARQPCHEKKPLSNAAGAFNLDGTWR